MDRDLAADAENLKAKGNEFLAKKEFDQAISYYTEAIKLNKNHVYFSNRSAAYLSKGYADSALKDANECISMKPDWPKGYGRKGAALHKLKKYDDAIAAYEEGLKVDASNAALQSGLEEVKKEKEGPKFGGPGGANPMAQLFGPDLFDRIRADPKISGYMSDPQYVQMMTTLQQNPNMMQAFMSDPRVMETVGALLGVNLSAMAGGDAAPGATPEEQAEAEKKRKEADKKREEERKKAEEERLKRAEEERRAKETPEERERRENKEKALEFKQQGNAHYKKKELEQALEQYSKAIEIFPEEMSFYTNKAAALLEMGNLEACIKECKEAITMGRSHQAPYEQIAKAYARMGNACYKHKKWTEAIGYYQSAQLECHSNDVARKLKKAEVEVKKVNDLEYRDAEKGATAKELGNEKFKQGKFPEAIEAYTEAIKRDPDNAVYFANRAAAYTKMMDFGRANDDCNAALKIDPQYVKAYSRRGAIEFFRKEYHKAMESYKKGLELDPENADCKEGLQRTMVAVRSNNNNMTAEEQQQRASRAMEDPEIRSIMQDPVMSQVLRDMSTDPAAAQKHMRDPSVAAKIEKLIAAGIVQTG